MKIYEDSRGQVFFMVEHPGQRRVFGPFTSKPIPAFRWSSLDTRVTTFFVGGTPVTIREVTDQSEKTREEVLAVPITDFGGVLALGVEGYLPESWDPATKAWTIDPRPKASWWNGATMEGMTWSVE